MLPDACGPVHDGDSIRVGHPWSPCACGNRGCACVSGRWVEMFSSWCLIQSGCWVRSAPPGQTTVVIGRKKGWLFYVNVAVNSTRSALFFAAAAAVRCAAWGALGADAADHTRSFDDTSNRGRYGHHPTDSQKYINRICTG